MTCIRLSPAASIRATDVGLVLRSDLGTFQLQGADVRDFVSAVVPLLDGSLDREEVADRLADRYTRDSVLALLALLEQHGLIEAAPTASDMDREQWRGPLEYFRKWMERPEEAMQRLREARVLLVGLEPWGVVCASELAAAGVGRLHLLDDREVGEDDLAAVRLWERSHLGAARTDALAALLSERAPWCRVSAGPLLLHPEGMLQLEDDPGDLTITAVAGDDLPVLRGVARTLHAAGRRSLSGHLDGLDAVVGPLVIPRETACWNCYSLRQLAHAEHPEAAHAIRESLAAERPKPRARTYLPPMAPLLGHLLALEALKILSGYTLSQLAGRLLVQNLVTLETTLHTIVRLPWCEVCGGAAAGIPCSGRGSSGGASFGAPEDAPREPPGAPRLDAIVQPEELRQRLAGWVDERVGIIQYLAVGAPDAAEPELPITATAVLASYTEGRYHPTEPEVGSGKGLTATDAMLGAVGEAIERYSAARYRKSALRRSAMNELSDDAFDPCCLCLYTEAQYDRTDFPFARFDPSRPIDWVRGWWLDTGEPVWLPALPTYFNFHAAPAERFCQVTSSGLAAGASLEDASRRALFELVERDAFMLTWLARVPGRRLQVDEDLGVGAREVVRQLEEHGARIELYLLQVETPFPVIAAVGYGDGKTWPGATVALAAHWSVRTAAQKAILEQGHVGPYVRRLMRERNQPIPARVEAVRTLLDHALYYVPAERASAFDFLRCRGLEPVSLGPLIEAPPPSAADCARRLSETGVRVAIADVTAPDVATGPFRVARALGTDAQPIHFGHSLARLANPRLSALLTRGLNPDPHPLA